MALIWCLEVAGGITIIVIVTIITILILVPTIAVIGIITGITIIPIDISQPVQKWLDLLREIKAVIKQHKVIVMVTVLIETIITIIIREILTAQTEQPPTI